MKITSILLFIISFWAFQNEEYGNIAGTVTDINNEPLIGASISIDGTSIGTMTDIEGKFRLQNIKTGTYNISVAYTGFVTQKIKDIIIKNNETTNIAIKLEASESLSEVVVIADRPSKNEAIYSVEGERKSEKLSEEKTSKNKKKTTKETTATKPTPTTPSPAAYTWESADKAAEPVKEKSKEVVVLTETDATYDTKKVESDDYTLLKKPIKNEIKVADEDAAPEIKSGQLTASEWNELNNWDHWKETLKGEFKYYINNWNLELLDRYALQVSGTFHQPIVDAPVMLIDNASGKEVWKSRTDNSGKAECWASINGISNGNYSFVLQYEDNQYSLDNAKPYEKGINKLAIPAACQFPVAADIMFVVDATGSMGDEINYLKAEMNDVLKRAGLANKAVNIRSSSVFYRDNGDAYLAIEHPFSENIQETTDFIKQQNADGGGDFPEAVYDGLALALQQDWNKNAIARLLFLVLDAPPHAEQLHRLEPLMREAAERGIKIIPITASGIDRSTELLMKSIAVMTNGTYVFLTDDSGIGDTHLTPTADEFPVDYLNDVLVRVIKSYIQFDNCNPNQQAIIKPKPIDTVAMVTEWSIFPNPAINNIFVKTAQKVDKISISDAQGKIVYTTNQTIIGDNNIPLANLPDGMYWLSIQKGDILQTKKLVKMNKNNHPKLFED